MEGFKYNSMDPQRGIIPRSIEEIFKYIENCSNESVKRDLIFRNLKESIKTQTFDTLIFCLMICLFDFLFQSLI